MTVQTAPSASRLSLLGRDFVGFRNALPRQLAAHPQEPEVDAQWLDTERLYDRLESSTEGDIGMVVTDWLPALIASGAVLPLNEVLDQAPPQDWPDGWSPSMRGLQTAPDGSVYGLPFHDGPMMFLYRLDLFGDPAERATFERRYGYELGPAQTWSQLVDIARHFNRPEEGLWGTVLAGYPDGHNNVYDYLLQLWSRGGELLDASGAPSINSEQGRAALAFLHDLWHVHQVVNPAAMGWDSVQSGEHFAAGEGAMMVNWCGFAALSALPGSPTAGKVRCAVVPAAEGSGGRSVSLNVYWVLAILKSCRDVPRAYDLLRHLVSPEMDRIVSEEGGTGTRLSTWRDPEIQRLSPYYEVLEDVHRSVESPPRIPEYPRINMVLSELVNSVITQTASVAEASERAEIEVAEIVAAS